MVPGDRRMHRKDMTSTAAVLAMLTGSALRDEVDRVAAAVGTRVVHVSPTAAISRKTWSAAAVVILDQPGARHCTAARLPRRTAVFVLEFDAPGVEIPAKATFEAAIMVGAQQVLAMPGQAAELVRALSAAADTAPADGRRGEVVAVIAGRGGAGASLFSAALADAANSALLVDLDPWGGGIDLLTGGEGADGLRWPDLTVQGGRLNWAAVRDALPAYRGTSVLSGTRRGFEPGAGAVDAVVEAGRSGGVTVVCDLPRRLTDGVLAALEAADLVVLVSQSDVRATAATAATASALTVVNPTIGLVVRGPSPGGLRATDVASIVGLPVLAAMRPEPMLDQQLERGGLRLRTRSPLSTAARRVLSVLGQNPVGALEPAA